MARTLDLLIARGLFPTARAVARTLDLLIARGLLPTARAKARTLVLLTPDDATFNYDS